MTHTQTIITLISGIVTLVVIVGGFGISLLRRWWELEKYIKSSMERDEEFKKADQKLKRKLRKLIEQKYADHIAFNERLTHIEDALHALQNPSRRR